MNETVERNHVYKAISDVMADLSKQGIAKDDINKFDKYRFRGIDAVYNALAPLLSKHGLLILPRVIERWSDERKSGSDKAVFYVTVLVELDFISSRDGSKHTIRVYGEAMDRGDKGTNKAMTSAYKYACFEAFCIPVEGSEDADAETHEVSSRKKTYPDDLFTKNLPNWKSLITDKKKSAQEIIDTILSKYDMTDDQVNTIEAI